MSERVEIRLDRPENTNGRRYCLLLDRAARSVEKLDVEIKAYIEGLRDEIAGSDKNPYYGRSIKFAGDSWAAGGQVVVVVEGEDVEEASRQVKDALQREPPSLSYFGIGPLPHQQPRNLQAELGENQRRYAKYLELRSAALARKQARKEMRGA